MIRGRLSASSAGALSRDSTSSFEVRITGMAFGWDRHDFGIRFGGEECEQVVRCLGFIRMFVTPLLGSMRTCRKLTELSVENERARRKV